MPAKTSAKMANPTVLFTDRCKVEVLDRPIPKPKRGQVLLRTRRTLISTGTELTVLSGDFPPGSDWAAYAKYPFEAGYSNVGEVLEVGAGVEKSWIGRRLVGHGTHARYTVGNPAVMTPVPEALDDERASFGVLAEITMNGVRRGGVGWGDAVVVYGQGLIGQLAARFARTAGAWRVFGVDTAEGRLRLVGKGILPVNPKTTDLVGFVAEHCHGRKADVVIETTGSPAVIPTETAALRRQGRLVILSSPRGPSQYDFNDLCSAFSYTIQGVHTGSHPNEETPSTPWTRHRHRELFYDMLVEGALDVRKLISHRFGYQDAPRAYDLLLTDRTKAMGVVLEWPE